MERGTNQVIRCRDITNESQAEDFRLATCVRLSKLLWPLFNPSQDSFGGDLCHTLNQHADWLMMPVD